MKFIERHPMCMIGIGIFGISLSAIIVRYSQAPSLVTAFYRLAFTVLFLLPAVILKDTYRKELHRTSKKLLGLSALGGVFLAIHFVTWFESLNLTSVASSTVIVCTEVIWVALGFVVFLGGKLSRGAVAAIMITLGGSLLITLSDYTTAAGHALYGDFLALFSAIVVALYTLIGRVTRTKMTTTVYTSVVYFVCFLTLALWILVTDTPLGGYGWNPIICGLLLSIFSTLLGHSIFSWCLKYFSPSFVSASKLLEPVVAAIFAAILFNEIPVLVQILGSAVILLGVLFYSRIESRERK